MNKLYQEYYPNILSTFWAYYLARLSDGDMPLFKHDTFPQSAFSNSKEFVELFVNDPMQVSVSRIISSALSESLESCFYEFMFLITSEDKLFLDRKREEYITERIENKYTVFAQDPRIIEEFKKAEQSILIDFESKLYDTRFPNGKYPQYLFSDVYKRGIIGSRSGAREITLAIMIEDIMGESFRPEMMLRLVSSVDMKNFQDVQIGTGSEKPEEIGRDGDPKEIIYPRYSLLNPGMRTGITSQTVSENSGPHTERCPGRRSANSEFCNLIKDHLYEQIVGRFPEYQIGEGIIGGLIRVVQEPIQELFADLKPYVAELREGGLSDDEFNILRGRFPTEETIDEDRAELAFDEHYENYGII